MCKIHWNQYTAGLARDAKARKAATADADATEPDAVETKPRRTKDKAPEPVAESTEAGAA